MEVGVPVSLLVTTKAPSSRSTEILWNKIRRLTRTWCNTDCVFLSCHICVSSQSTPCNSLNFKERLAQNRRNIGKLSDCNGTRTHNHLVCKRILNHLTKLQKLPQKNSNHSHCKTSVVISKRTISNFSIFFLQAINITTVKLLRFQVLFNNLTPPCWVTRVYGFFIISFVICTMFEFFVIPFAMLENFLSPKIFRKLIILPDYHR